MRACLATAPTYGHGYTSTTPRPLTLKSVLRSSRLVHCSHTAQIFNALLDDPQRPGHGWDGFYFVETGELRMIDVVKTVEKALLQLDKIKPTAGTLVPWSQEEIDKYFYGVNRFSSSSHV
jgi:hypothetical protein